MAAGTIRYWAAARAAAGVADEPFDGNTLAEVIESAATRHGPELRIVLDRCSRLVDGQRADRTSLSHAALIDVLPPVAGG